MFAAVMCQPMILPENAAAPFQQADAAARPTSTSPSLRTCFFGLISVTMARTHKYDDPHRNQGIGKCGACCLVFEVK